MIDQEYLLFGFYEGEVPPFPCPTCRASLVMREKGITYHQSRLSREDYEQTRNPETECGTFTLHLVCSHGGCKEAVNCIGKYALVQDARLTGESFIGRLITPLFFNPTIQLFGLPPSIPDQIRKPLLDSFSLFWSNPHAAANSLRIAVEALMEHQRINKSARSKSGKRHMRNLHERIEEFAIRKPEIGDKLLAIKWLGNSGSHQSGALKPEDIWNDPSGSRRGGLKPQDLISGFKLLQYAVEELFEKRRHKLTRLAKKINRRKGPV
jgi:hypothetical protein